MSSSYEPTGPRHHCGCRSADARSSVTTMPTLQLLIICTTARNYAGERSAGRQTVIFYCWRGRLFTSKVHHPGIVIMMVANGLAPKRHLSRMTSYIIQGSVLKSTNSAWSTQHQQITNNTDKYFINFIKSNKYITS